MNILGIIVIALICVCAIRGFKTGLVEGIIRLVSSILGIIVLYVLAKGLGSFIQGNVLNVIMALIILMIIRLFHRIIKLILDSCMLVSKVPVLKLIDKITGIVLGIIQGIVLVWAMFALGGFFHFWIFEEWVMEQIASNRLLRVLYHSNYIIYFISRL